MYLLIADTLTAAAATATEIGHLISKGILGLGEKKGKEKASILTLLPSWLCVMQIRMFAPPQKESQERTSAWNACCQHQLPPSGRIR